MKDSERWKAEFFRFDLNMSCIIVSETNTSTNSRQIIKAFLSGALIFFESALFIINGISAVKVA